MRQINAKFAKRCATCDDWIKKDAAAIYDPETKRMWHDSAMCWPKEWQPSEETAEQLAARLNFHPCE